MGLLSGFIGAAAESGGRILGSQIQNEQDINKAKTLADYNAELDAKKMAVLEEMKIAGEGRAEGRTIAGEDRAVKRARDEASYQAGPEARSNRKAIAQGTADDSVEIATGLIGAKAKMAGDEFVANAPLRQATRDEELQSWKDKFSVMSETQLQAEITKMNDPKHLAGIRKEAQARHIEGPDRGAGLRSLQEEALRLTLDEKKAEIKIPAAVRDEISGLRELLKGKSTVIDKAIADGTANPDGLAKLEAEKSAISQRISELRAPYMPAGTAAPTGGDEQKAQADARAAIATGKIDATEANKRLAKAGFSPLVDADASSGQPGGLIGSASKLPRALSGMGIEERTKPSAALEATNETSRLAKKSDTVTDERLSDEIAGLTVGHIRSLDGKEARNILSKYGQQIPENLRRELRKRM